MRLEIRDLESSMVYDIGEGGAVIGRERARTDISFRDESISKRHAQIYLEGSEWLLKDLGSSNGTYLDDQRVDKPVRLDRGVVFSLAQRRFEVVMIEGAAGPSDPHSMVGPADEGFMGPIGDSALPNGSMDESHRPPADDFASNSNHGSGAGGADEEPEAKGAAYFFIAVPKAIAYYLARVPLMAVNPLGSIRNGIENQKLAPMGKMELAAYAIPAFVFSALMGTLCSSIGMLIGGNFGNALSNLVLGAIPAAISIVVAVVWGFIFHPVCTFFIERLFKGETNARSRTNYGIMSLTFVVLTTVPNGIGQIIAGLGIIFLQIIPALLGLLVSLIGLFMVYNWFKHFKVIKWVEYVVLVFGVLTVLGTGASLVQVVIASLSGGGGSTEVAEGVDPNLNAEAQKAIADAKKAAEEARKKVEEAGKAGIEDANKIAEAGNKTAEENGKKAVEMANKIENGNNGTQNGGNNGKTENSGKTENAGKVEPPPPPPAVRSNGSSGFSPSAPPASGMSPFAAYLKKRESIEKTVFDNPRLIKRRDIRGDYERLWKVTYEVREKWRKKKTKQRWKRDKINQHLKNLEVFEKTQSYVDRLYKRLY